MQIPSIDDFRHDPGTEYGPPWSAPVEGTSFALTLPDGGAGDQVNGEWRPHGASYEIALAALPQADSLREQALAFLARQVDFGKLGLQGEASVSRITCDGRGKQQVTVELAWPGRTDVRLGVTFSWRMNHAQLPDLAWPFALSCRFV